EEDDETAPILHSTSSNLTLQYSGHYDSPQNSVVAENNSQIKVYKWRWVVLAIFVAVMGVNNAVWIAFASIADVVQCYYNMSKFWVNSASMVYMATYILFIVPSAWLLGRVGLRTALVIAAGTNAAGSCLRVAGAGPTAGSFWVMLSGQAIASLCNLLLWGTPSYLAGVWFPASERGTAAAIVGALAPQLGVVCSYVLGPLLVHSDDTNTVCGGNATVDPELHNEWTNTIHYQMIYYSSGLAGISLLFFFLSLIAVPNAPPTPPSRSQLLVESYSNQDNTFAKTLKAILTNRYFILLLVTASINLGAAGAIVSLFNEIIHPFFKNRDRDVVYIGIAALVPGMITVFIVGPILSATKAFYALNVGLYITAFLSIGGFLAALQFVGNFYMLYPFCCHSRFECHRFSGGCL
ncbi:Uncharacterized MFS-type transporter C09D4.1, partial [Geodia barretti]